MKQPTFSVLIPAYKSEKIIGETIISVLGQTFGDLEVIIVDDNSPDSTEKAIRKFKDGRIKFFKNPKNLGYAGNLERCRYLARGKFIYLVGNDDILSPLALERTYNAFLMDRDIGVVTRPYFWFEDKAANTAVRIVRPLDAAKDRVVTIFDSQAVFMKVFESVGQLSGLAYRRAWIDLPIHLNIFPAHIYPFLSIFKRHKAVFLKDYVVAIRIFSSQTRSLSSIYDPSPTLTWVRMFQRVLAGKKYSQPRKWGINHICLNFEGLVQIRNYAHFSLFFKEIAILVKYRPKSLLNLKFWFFVIGLTLVPRIISIRMVDWYKGKVNASKLRNISLYTKPKNRAEIS